MSYKPYYTGGWQSGESGGTPLTPEALQHFDNGIISAHRAGQPQNLLDNSYFQYSNSYPTDGAVNQRNTDGGGFAQNTFVLDRWFAVDGDVNCYYTSDGIRISNNDGIAGIAQRVKFNRDDIGLNYFTLAAMTERGILIASGLLTDANTWKFVAQAENAEIKIRLGRYADADWRFRVDILPKEGQEVVLKWVALYRGEYTAETLPEYQPKGYAAELAECRRYYCRLDTADAGVYGVVLQGMITSGNKDIILALPITTMRIARPTATISGGVVLRGISGYIENSDSGISVSLATLSNGVGHNIRVNKTDGTVFSVNAVNNTPVTLSLSAGSYMELSADL